jgi:hypothetical protein
MAWSAVVDVLMQRHRPSISWVDEEDIFLFFYKYQDGARCGSSEKSVA